MAYLTPRYDPLLVLASVLIASFASYVALGRRVNRDGHRHLVHALRRHAGVLAADRTGLHPAADLHLVGRRGRGVGRGFGTGQPRLADICAMHYLGMAALDMAPPIDWNAALVAASAAVAVVASAAALI